MRMDWKVLVVATGLTLAGTMGAGMAMAQGPAGAGATTAASSSNSSSGGTHSLNPIKWVKKTPKTDNSADASADRDAKLTAKLQSAGVLAADKDVKSACSTFKDVVDCVAALHVSHNLALDFNCVQADVTGVHTGADLSGCKGDVTGKSESLAKAVHTLKPDANAKAEAKNAEKQAQADLNSN